MSEQTSESPTQLYPNRRRRNSIFVRSAAFSSIIVCVTVVVCVAFFWHFLAQVQLDDLTEKTRVVAQNLEYSTSQSMAIKDYAAVVETCLEVIKTNRDIKYIVISPQEDATLGFTSKGWTMVQDTDLWDSTTYQSVNASLIDNPLGPGDVLRYAYPIKYETLEYGWVHVGYDVVGYRNNLEQLFSKTILLAVVTLFIGILAAVVFSTQLIRPIKQLQQFAGHSASGDLDTKIEMTSHGELSELASSMNVMSLKLKASREKLRNSLEQEASLREKEILLREIHHRVKNNMQILGSLIRMQARRIGDESLRPVFKESEDRIRSMSLIHEKLYQSESLSRIDLQSYLEDLTNELFRVYGATSRAVTIDVVAHDVFLELDTAVPCGLIVNELVSNALKYAFPDQSSGKISVSLTANPQTGEHTLLVSDTGIGLPPELDIETSDSLGLKLVNMLVGQLNGSVGYANGIGSEFSIGFMQSTYTERV